MPLVRKPSLPSYPCGGPGCDNRIIPTEKELREGTKKYFCIECGWDDILFIPPDDYNKWRDAHTPLDSID